MLLLELFPLRIIFRLISRLMIKINFYLEKCAFKVQDKLISTCLEVFLGRCLVGYELTLSSRISVNHQYTVQPRL